MRIAWSGQHTRTKALPILLRALADLDRSGLHLDVVGDGRQRCRYEKCARKLGVSDIISWHGWLAKDAAKAIVARCDIFVITSLKDLTSTVLLEALSLGKPIVCIDHCGFSDVVDESCGIKIPVGPPKDVIQGFASAIERLKDGELRRKLSLGALAKSRLYQWDEKTKILGKIYGDGGKRVLVSAYACSPYRGSEPGMGWNFLKIIASTNEVCVIVEEEKWKSDIEKYLAENPDEMKSVHWIFIHKPRARRLRKIWPPSYYWFYRIWQWRAYKKASELHKEVHFDIVHQLNMVGFREPGYLWKLDAPFVWGPIGGLGYTDVHLLPLAGFWGAVELLARNLINFYHSHFLLRPYFAARKAVKTGCLLSATKENQKYAKRLWGADSTVLCEIGV